MSEAIMAVFAGAIGLLFVSALISLITGGFPLITLADWIEERSKTQRILAQARLQEAKNAARPGGPDAHS